MRCVAGSTRTASPSVTRVFDPKGFIEEQVAAIRGAVDGGPALVACSGGVDSTTPAVLASRALGDRLVGVYVDTGLMRQREPAQLSRTLKALGAVYPVLQEADAYLRVGKGIEE